MINIISRKKILKLIKNKKTDIFFLGLAFLFFGFNVFFIFKFLSDEGNNTVVINRQESNNQVNINENKEISKVYVDVSGAVVNPGIYLVKEGTRIKQVVDLAGGLNKSAASDFFYRNYNLALPVYDGQKIYVPYIWEVRRGLIKEPIRTFDFTGYDKFNEQNLNYAITEKSDNNLSNGKINVNTATQKELEALPGIGPKTAEKIIQNRPFSSIEELYLKKILNKTVYENLKERLSV